MNITTYNHIHSVVKNGMVMNFGTSFVEVDHSSSSKKNIEKTSYSYDCSNGDPRKQASSKDIFWERHGSSRTKLEASIQPTTVSALVKTEDIKVRSVIVKPQSPLFREFKVKPEPINIFKLKSGDHIFYITNNGSSEHHAVVLTDMTGKTRFYKEDPLEGGIQVIHFDGTSTHTAEVKQVSLRDYFRNKKREIYIVRYIPEVRKIAAVCCEAFRALGTKGFNRASFNCEHFATYCKTGVAFSLQTYRITLMDEAQKKEAERIVKLGPEAVATSVASGGVMALIAPKVIDTLGTTIASAKATTAVTAIEKPILANKTVQNVLGWFKSHPKAIFQSEIENFTCTTTTGTTITANGLNVGVQEGQILAQMPVTATTNSGLTISSDITGQLTQNSLNINSQAQVSTVGGQHLADTALNYQTGSIAKAPVAIDKPLAMVAAFAFSMIGNVMAKALGAENFIEGAIIGGTAGAFAGASVGASTGTAAFGPMGAVFGASGGASGGGSG